MRKGVPPILYPKWGAVDGLGLSLYAMADLPDALENVRAAFSMGETILHYIVLFAAIYFGGLLVWWTVPTSVK